MCSLEIEAIFAKTAKMAIFRLFARVKSVTVGDFLQFEEVAENFKFFKKFKILENFSSESFFFYK